MRNNHDDNNADDNHDIHYSQINVHKERGTRN